MKAPLGRTLALALVACGNSTAPDPKIHDLEVESATLTTRLHVVEAERERTARRAEAAKGRPDPDGTTELGWARRALDMTRESTTIAERILAIEKEIETRETK